MTRLGTASYEKARRPRRSGSLDYEGDLLAYEKARRRALWRRRRTRRAREYTSAQAIEWLRQHPLTGPASRAGER